MIIVPYPVRTPVLCRLSDDAFHFINFILIVYGGHAARQTIIAAAISFGSMKNANAPCRISSGWSKIEADLLVLVQATATFYQWKRI